MRVAVVTFPGSNCDYDCYKALQLFPGFEPSFVWHRERELGDVDAVVLPGGFAHGDYLRAGAIARFSPVMSAVDAFAAPGVWWRGSATASRCSARAGSCRARYSETTPSGFAATMSTSV